MSYDSYEGMKLDTNRMDSGMEWWWERKGTSTIITMTDIHQNEKWIE